MWIEKEDLVNQSSLSFILSNTIESQLENASNPISREMREGRFERLNDLSLLPTSPWTTIDSTELEICSIWLSLDIHNNGG